MTVTYPNRWFRVLLYVLVWSVTTTAFGAVSSTGEINVQDDPSGRVPTSSRPTLVVTMLVDRSKAEAGEEIKTIQIFLPSGFTMTASDVRSVKIEGAAVPYDKTASGDSLRIVLASPIDNFLSSIIEIVFDIQTPDEPQKEALFRVALRNREDVQIGEFIKPGEIDGDPSNNNDYTLEVFPNVPPSTPVDIAAKPDPDGENDAIISWSPSTDADVKGYLILRDGTATLDAVGIERKEIRDVNALPGIHTYRVAAYKSKLVISPYSDEVAVTIPPDTHEPDKVPSLSLRETAQGVELKWIPSPSRDVVAYDVLLSRDGGTFQLLQSVSQDATLNEYVFVQREHLPTGRYRYAVEAMDEAGNRSVAVEAVLTLLDAPFPNPFTPLGSPPFNVATFPTRAIADAQGDLTVRIFDLHGRQVRAITSTAGDAEWDGRDENGDLLRGGIYVYQMEIGGSFRVGTIVLIR
jgi:hypothetical protein